MTTVYFILVELAFLAVTHRFGSPPWTVIGVVAILALMPGGVRIESLALAVPSLFWLGLSHATGNRELFFPYAMYLASCVALRDSDRAAWPGTLGAGLIVGVFMIIRTLQQATVRILAVEFAVAAAILTLVIMARSWIRRNAARPAQYAWRAAIAAASSLLAYASLAL